MMPASTRQKLRGHLPTRLWKRPQPRVLVGPAVFCLIVVPGIAVILLAAIGPWIAPHPPGASVGAPFMPPGEGHFFGTDRLGRDLWSQALHGGRSLLVVPLVATALTVAVGTALGITIGYIQGRVDTLVLGAIDVFLVLPDVVLVLVLANWWGGGAGVVVLTMLLSGTPILARISRAAALEVIRAPFVQVSITQGDRTLTILRREVLPNIAGPVLASSGLMFVGALYLSAALSLLGFRPQPPDTNWALMIIDNVEGAGLNIWAMTLPAILVAMLSVSGNMILQAFANRIAR